MKKICLLLLICYSIPSFAQDELEDKSFSFISTNFWLIPAGLLFSILFILVFKAFQKIKELDSHLRKVSRNIESITPNSSPFTNQKSKAEEQIRHLNERIHKLEIAKTDIPKPVIQEEKKEEESREVIFHIPRKESETSVFYMSTPNGEKIFEMRGKSNDFIPTRSLYKFFVNASGDEASFEFHSDESGVKESANSPHLYIEPVCDPQNAQNPNAKNIITVQKGTAEREGDKWIVKQKAKIEYR